MAMQDNDNHGSWGCVDSKDEDDQIKQSDWDELRW